MLLQRAVVRSLGVGIILDPAQREADGDLLVQVVALREHRGRSEDLDIEDDPKFGEVLATSCACVDSGPSEGAVSASTPGTWIVGIPSSALSYLDCAISRRAWSTSP